MNKLIKDLTTDELYQLVNKHMYKDLAPVHGLDNAYVSEAHKVVVYFSALARHTERIPLVSTEYAGLMDWALAAGREPLCIFSTPLGIWEFNLELMNPDAGRGVVTFNVNKGEPILAWYPNYDSEDDWVNAAMEELSEAMYVDPAEQDLEMLIEDMINSDEDYDSIKYDN